MNYDINLLPKSDKELSGFDMFLTGVIIFAIILAAAYAGFYLPLNNRVRLNNEITNKENELSSLNEQLVEYTDLVNLVSDLEAKINIIKSLQKNYIKTSLILSDIEQSMPVEIILITIDINDIEVKINGHSPNLNLISQFMVNLRNKEHFSDVSFDEARLYGSDSDSDYVFELNIVLADSKSVDEEGAVAE